MRILIADDDSISRRVLQKNLETLGHEVLSAKNGLEAFDIFTENHIRFVIADWMMPEMDGVTLCRKIRDTSDSSYVYFILLTSKGRREDIVEGMNAGADDYITKPFNREELSVRVQAGERVVTLEQQLADRVQELERAEQKLQGLLKEKEVLIKEVHHRVKNNFAVVASLLNLQSGQLKDEHDKEIFIQSGDRVRSMALIHERLYKSENLADINFADYIKTLANGLYQSFVADSSRIALVTELEDVALGVDQAIPTGLIVNELLSNSFKYAFPQSRNGKGEIKIALREIKNNTVELSVNDNGVGLPENFDIKNSKSLGLKLVTMLAEKQLKGSYELIRENGTAFMVQFKKAS